jgi:hypothetical protein
MISSAWRTRIFIPSTGIRRVSSRSRTRTPPMWEWEQACRWSAILRSAREIRPSLGRRRPQHSIDVRTR